VFGKSRGGSGGKGSQALSQESETEKEGNNLGDKLYVLRGLKRDVSSETRKRGDTLKSLNVGEPRTGIKDWC